MQHSTSTCTTIGIRLCLGQVVLNKLELVTIGSTPKTRLVELPIKIVIYKNINKIISKCILSPGLLHRVGTSPKFPIFYSFFLVDIFVLGQHTKIIGLFNTQLRSTNCPLTAPRVNQINSNQDSCQLLPPINKPSACLRVFKYSIYLYKSQVISSKCNLVLIKTNKQTFINVAVANEYIV